MRASASTGRSCRTPIPITSRRIASCVCTAATARLMRARRVRPGTVHALPFGQTEPLTPTTAVTLYPAGPHPGLAPSACSAHDAHGTLLYTGDCKLDGGLAAEPCEPAARRRADHGDHVRPAAVRLSRRPTRCGRDIVDFCRRGAGRGSDTPCSWPTALARVRSCCRCSAGAAAAVMLHAQAYRLTRIYEELGMVFPPYPGLCRRRPWPGTSSSVRSSWGPLAHPGRHSPAAHGRRQRAGPSTPAPSTGTSATRLSRSRTMPVFRAC